MLAGFRGQSIPVELRVLAREFSLGGIVLRARNIVEAAQALELAQQARDLTPVAPPWVSTHPATASGRICPDLADWPAWNVIGHADAPSLTRRLGRALARERRAIGLTLMFAPPLDLSDDGLAADAERAGRHAVAILEALHAEGIAACAGAFPGLGTARANGGDVPVVEAPPDHLRHVDWAPLRTAMASGLDAMRVSHALTTLDESRVASLSREVVRGALREAVGFDGVAVADDLDALPPARRPAGGESAVAAIAAGCDVVIQGSDDMDVLAATLEALVRAVEDESLPYARVDDALRRQSRMKLRWLSDDVRRTLPPAPSLREIVASTEHAVLAEELRSFA